MSRTNEYIKERSEKDPEFAGLVEKYKEQLENEQKTTGITKKEHLG